MCLTWTGQYINLKDEISNCRTEYLRTLFYEVDKGGRQNNVFLNLAQIKSQNGIIAK